MTEILGDIERHFWLTRSMARTVGVNLSEAMSAGIMAPDEYSRMVTRCRQADCAERCAEWLGQHTSGSVSDPPPFCAHASQLKALLPN